MVNKRQFNSLQYIFSYFFLVSVVFLFAFTLLKFPAKAGEGVQKGIEMSVYTLIPSMYPFMFLSCFLVNSSLAEKCGRVFSFFTEKLFRLPGCCGAVIVMSMIGGLPVGAAMTDEMHKKGYITINQGKRLLLFCINPGPAFVINTVGYYMAGNRSVGTMLYFSLVISSLTIGLLSRFVIKSEDSFIIKASESEKISFQNAVVASVSQSSRSMLNVCSWVVLFSCLCALMELLPVSEGTDMFLTGVMEMTKGCEKSAETMQLPVTAAILGFGGICAHLQIMPAITEMKLPLKYFFCSRIINSGLTVIVFSVLFKNLPLSQQTVSIGHLPERISNEISLPVCIGIMFMCMLFLLGENFRIKKKQ